MAFVTLQDALLQVEEGVSRARSCYHLLKDTLCLWSGSYVGHYFQSTWQRFMINPDPKSLSYLFFLSLSLIPSSLSLPQSLSHATFDPTLIYKGQLPRDTDSVTWIGFVSSSVSFFIKF